MMNLRNCLLLLAVLFFLGTPLFAQNSTLFRPDDPLLIDPDQNPIPQPEGIRLSQIYDLLENSFIRRLSKNETVQPAANVNTIGEVPDSSWFTNRMGKTELTIEELVKGPNLLNGPDLTQPLTIIGAKTEGVTPGFTVRDAAGEVYFLKFDPPTYPQLMTSTEVVVTKFFYAFGYNVPENYLTFIPREGLVIGDEALLTDEEGKERRLTHRDLDRIFSKVYQSADETTPAVASRRLPGVPLGPFKYLDTRHDDPNDIFPHQDRRELRGLRLFCAWLNHDDSRSLNTLDMYVGEPGKGFVKHHLIDFGSCLGSGSVKPQSRRAGNEYIIEWTPILKATLTLGIWDRPWRHVRYPDFPSVGRFESDFFQPHLWRPEYPNPAFDRLLPEDAFWAVRIILRFNDEMIQALVATGQYSDQAAADYLVKTIIQRRDRIVEHYLPKINSLDDFQVKHKNSSSFLEFRNLASELGIKPAGPYNYQWYSFTNATGSLDQIDEPESVRTGPIEIVPHRSKFLVVRIAPADQPAIDVYLRNQSGTFKVVGLDRESEDK
jgi:hypothetical protein